MLSFNIYVIIPQYTRSTSFDIINNASIISASIAISDQNNI